MPKLGDISKGIEIGLSYKNSNWDKYIWLACSICGKERWTRSYNGKPKFTKCNSCAKSGKNNPLWKDGRSRGRGINVWQPKERHSIQEHRLVMEKYLGRKLTHDEVVHHINKNRLDNRIENLMLFENDSKHKVYHHKIGKYIGVYKDVHRRKVKREAEEKDKRISNRKKYQAQYYKDNLERLKKYKKLQYVNKHKKVNI